MIRPSRWTAGCHCRSESGGLARCLVFKRDRNCGIRRQTHLLSFDIRDQPEIDVMMMALVTSLAAVGLRQLDPVFLNTIDGPDVNAIRADHFHMFLDPTVAHLFLLATGLAF